MGDLRSVRRRRAVPARVNKVLRTLALATTTFSALGANARAGNDVPIYKKPDAPLEQRVEDLLGRMTLEEKIAQITCIWDRKRQVLTASGDFDPTKAHQLFPA